MKYTLLYFTPLKKTRLCMNYIIHISFVTYNGRLLLKNFSRQAVFRHQRTLLVALTYQRSTIFQEDYYICIIVKIFYYFKSRGLLRTSGAKRTIAPDSSPACTTTFASPVWVVATAEIVLGGDRWSPRVCACSFIAPPTSTPPLSGHPSGRPLAQSSPRLAPLGQLLVYGIFREKWAREGIPFILSLHECLSTKIFTNCRGGSLGQVRSHAKCFIQTRIVSSKTSVQVATNA